MVFLTKILKFATEKKPPRRHMRNVFIDSLRLLVKAGNGGNGFPKYGGVGGQGGDIYVIATEDETLESLLKKCPKKRVVAPNGTNSHQKYILGPPGEAVKIEVPVGITVLREDGKIIGELNEPETELLVARGGEGGHPKNGFIGMKGQSHIINLDLKLIADVGLVGFPNAGKSTLLKAISKAKPKIANYPFTTIRPNVGTIEYKDLRQITMADLPGLIEGAHANIGMGHKFLKHVERTKLLMLVVDINGFQLNYRHQMRSCLDTIVLLNKELELYKPELLTKPAMIVINKMDTDGAPKKFDEIKHKIRSLEEIVKDYPVEVRPIETLKFDEVLAISAQAGGEGINYLKDRIRNILDLHAEIEANEKENQLQQHVELMRTTQEKLRERGPKLV